MLHHTKHIFRCSREKKAEEELKEQQEKHFFLGSDNNGDGTLPDSSVDVDDSLTGFDLIFIKIFFACWDSTKQRNLSWVA